MDKEQSTRKALDLAEEHFFIAQEEHCRPEEDMMPYKVCRSSYKSVGNYLAAYLENKGLVVKDEMSLEYLHNACKGLEPAFDELDLAILFYGNEHDLETIWADENTMNNYLEIAQRTKEIFEAVTA